MDVISRARAARRAPAEVEIRAATIEAVERLAKELRVRHARGLVPIQARGRTRSPSPPHPLPAAPPAASPAEPPRVLWAQVDWFLWEEGERLAAAGRLAPHHRTRTTFY